MSIFSFIPQPYGLLAELAAGLALVGGLMFAGYHMNHEGEKVQASWDKQKAADALERDKKLFRDSENNNQADTAVTKRIAASSHTDDVIVQRISNVQTSTACTRLPLDIGVLLNNAALGTEPDPAAARQLDGPAPPAPDVHPVPAQ